MRTLLPLLLFVLLPASAPALSVEELRAHVEFLASDALRGRDTGSEGERRAADYVAARFASAGLRPLPGEDGFLQPVLLHEHGFDVAASAASLEIAGDLRPGRLGVDLGPLSFSSTGEVDVELVFAGYGITAPEYDWDDYEGLDVRGKAVLVLRFEPGHADPRSPFAGLESTPHALFTEKAENARKHGAVALLVVTGPLQGHLIDDLRVDRGLGLEPDEVEAPEESLLALRVRRGWVSPLFEGERGGLEGVQRRMDEGVSPHRLSLPDAQLRLRLARSARGRPLPVHNVAGMVPGSDPALANDWILIGAHHDHIGAFEGPGDTIFNGADDNASGVAVLLELARHFARHPPARSLAFVTFTGEERGLLGSRALVRRQLLDTDRVRLMLNLDMLGRNEDRPVQVFGDGLARGLRDAVERANARVDLPLRFHGRAVPANSDHRSFYDADIPVLSFFSGTHEDYHQVDDHADRIVYGRVAAIGSLLTDLLGDLATIGPEGFPVFRHNLAWLGAQIEERWTGASREPVVSGVEKRAPADRLGLRAGDVLLCLGADDFRPARSVGRRLRELPFGQEVSLEFRRQGERAKLLLRRPYPGFLGIVHAPLEGRQRERLEISDHEGLRVEAVLPEGPARAAGLEPGDVLLRVDDRPVRYETLVGRLEQIGAGATVDLLVLREGAHLSRRATLARRPETP